MSKQIKNILSLIEIILTFILAIYGNKISEFYKIEKSTLLLLITSVILLIFLVSLFRTSFNKKNKYLAEFFPKTIIENIPIGIFFGVLCAFVVGKSIGQTPWSFINSIFIIDINIFADDVAITLIGTIIAIVFATFINSHLSQGIAIGYGIGVPPALIFSAHSGHKIFHSILGYFFIFCMVAYFIPKYKDRFILLKYFLTKEHSPTVKLPNNSLQGTRRTKPRRAPEL